MAKELKGFVNEGEMSKAVLDIWIHMWQQDKELNRKYTY